MHEAIASMSSRISVRSAIACIESAATRADDTVTSSSVRAILEFFTERSLE